MCAKRMKWKGSIAKAIAVAAANRRSTPFSLKAHHAAPATVANEVR